MDTRRCTYFWSPKSKVPVPACLLRAARHVYRDVFALQNIACYSMLTKLWKCWLRNINSTAVPAPNPSSSIRTRLLRPIVRGTASAYVRYRAVSTVRIGLRLGECSRGLSQYLDVSRRFVNLLVCQLEDEAWNRLSMWESSLGLDRCRIYWEEKYLFPISFSKLTLSSLNNLMWLCLFDFRLSLGLDQSNCYNAFIGLYSAYLD